MAEPYNIYVVSDDALDDLSALRSELDLGAVRHIRITNDGLGLADEGQVLIVAETPDEPSAV